jgi:RNA polymerase sigma-70 factor, ECF subfamily
MRPRGSYDVAMSPGVERRVRELIATGEVRAAATEAIRALAPDVLRFLRSLLRDESDAADAFSEFAENLWTGLETFRGEASLRTWALRLARNAALNLRGEAWRRRGRRLATGEASALAEDLRTKSFVRVERQRAALDKLRESLSMEDRMLLVLRLDQGLSWKEAAEVLASEGDPADVNALTKRFERLKDKLGKMAREEGLIE